MRKAARRLTPALALTGGVTVLLNCILCVIAGALGGAVYHAFWLIKLGHTSSSPPSDSRRHRNFRISLLALSVATGAAMAFLVWLWFAGNAVNVGPKINQIAVYAAIAGLSGEAALNVLRKIASI